MAPERFSSVALAAALVLFAAAHVPLLSLPFHWDELGYFIPAALDLWRDGHLVPQTTLANIHPPGVPLYLAGVWTIFGYSIAVTRAAMLVLAIVTALASWSLARRLGVASPLAAVVFLLASPLFFMQAMMAQLDMPAMLFTTVALLYFLAGRLGPALVVCVLLVLAKETGLIAPMVLAGWLALDRRYRWAAAFALLPAAVLLAWILYLRQHTGLSVGNAEFGWYNLVYPLHPVRLAAAVLRRVSYLFFEEFRWIPTLVLLLSARRTWSAPSRPWRVVLSFAVLHVAGVTVVGGAVLERYLLPALPILYAAAARVLEGRPALQAALAAGLVASLFLNPPFWPFPHENNLAMVDFVRLQQIAAADLETRYPATPVFTTWPLSDALKRPELGYVSRPLTVSEAPEGAVYVVYSTDWDPPANLIRLAPVRALVTRYFMQKPPRRPSGRALDKRWEQKGFWLEVYRP
ncbi:MAG: hypothetical protein SFV54_01995 [Bryobacteraceae bacterium]|nr:hypothetical protein [Bryobacteraceae bacterium]